MMNTTQGPIAATATPLPTWEKARGPVGMSILLMMKREQGASLDEIAEATGWQKNTIRGFFAGQQLRRTGHRAERFIRANGQPAYKATIIQPEETN